MGSEYKFCKLQFIFSIFSIMIFLFLTPLTNYLYSFLEVKSQYQDRFFEDRVLQNTSLKNSGAILHNSDAILHNCDAILLLSAEQYGDHIFGINTYQRIFQAFTLYQKGYGNKLIIISGGVVSVGSLSSESFSSESLSSEKIPNRLSIAESIRDILIMMGVDKERIIVETTSQNTYSNFLNIKPILKKMNINEIILVTSSYHMFRSLAVSRKLGIHAYPAPVPCYEKNIDHAVSRLKFSVEIIREYGAIVYFWMRGWI